jgi:hypothetical protein
MRHPHALAPALLMFSLLSATAVQAAPILNPPLAPVNLPLPPAPEPLLEALSGGEFPSALVAVAETLSSNRALPPRPSKPRLQVPEPNGLILLSLGVFGMGVLRLRAKNQTL